MSKRAIGLFGGTFDPIHSGHLAAARAACREFGLSEVHFVPSARPPHKRAGEMAPFADRYAMVVLACAGHPDLVASRLEADTRRRRPYYTLETIERARRKFGSRVKLYFLVGADSFQEIPTWKEWEKLLEACDFIVVNRPGYSLKQLRRVIPARLLSERSFERHRDLRLRRAGRVARGERIALRRTSVYLLQGVEVPVSSTTIRRRAARGLSLRGMVPRIVEEYIRQRKLYRS
jgi:nicotinate-nucleotide adenylyltransferase